MRNRTDLSSRLGVLSVSIILLIGVVGCAATAPAAVPEAASVPHASTEPSTRAAPTATQPPTLAPAVAPTQPPAASAAPTSLSATWHSAIPMRSLISQPTWFGDADSAGRAYMFEAPGSIVVYDANGSVVRRIGKAGSRPGEFNFGEVKVPLYGGLVQGAALAFLPDGSLVVADGGNHRVQILDAQGNYLRSWGREGAGDGEFEMPWAVAVDANGVIYVGDFSGTIQKFDRQGQFLGRMGGGQGLSEGKFVAAVDDVGVDGQGNVFASDSKSGYITRFDSRGRFVTRWDRCGKGYMSIRGLAVTSEGLVYVASEAGQHVCVFDTNGVLLAEWGSRGSGAGQFGFGSNGADLSVHPDGLAYVTDPGNGRIQVFALIR